MNVRLRPSTALRVALLTLALIIASPAIIAAIYVTPTTIFMDPRSNDAQIIIGNSGDQPEEATIELRFGFPDVDSAGTPYIRFIEDPGPEFSSAADWIRPFPQRVRLEPGTQQVVRLLARPPEGLADGEYYTRMIVTGRGSTVQLPTRGDSSVHVGVGLEIRLVTSITYRKGDLHTGIQLRGLTAEAEGDSLSVWANMRREGNAGYLGTADIELAHFRGPVVKRWSMPLAVFYPMRRRFAFPVDSLTPGDYRVRFRLRAERPDLPRERVLPAPTVTDSITLRVN